MPVGFYFINKKTIMFYFFYFIFLSFNMIFFGIINIPLFKYFCDLPTSTFFEVVENDFFFKFYFYSNINFCYLYDFIQYSNIFSFSYFFYFYNSFFFFISYFFFYIHQELYSISCDYIEVVFQTNTTNYNFIEFCTLQRFIYVIPNETHLVFFRMYNSIGYEISGISIYLLYPTDYLVYFNKIQCFCFEELLLYPYESIDLPVIFYISSDILHFVDFFYSNKLFLSYLFLTK